MLRGEIIYGAAMCLISFFLLCDDFPSCSASHKSLVVSAGHFGKHDDVPE